MKNGDELYTFNGTGLILDKNNNTFITWGNTTSRIFFNYPLINLKKIVNSGGVTIILYNNNIINIIGNSLPSNITNENIIDVATGVMNFYIVKNNMIYCWGNFNDNGQLTPPTDGSNTNIIAVAAGRGHVIGLKNDGSIMGFGGNNRNQLNFPWQINYYKGITSINAIEHLTMAIRGSDNAVFVWGYSPVASNLNFNPPTGLNLISTNLTLSYLVSITNDKKLIVWGGRSPKSGSILQNGNYEIIDQNVSYIISDTAAANGYTFYYK
jgi:hypothetical protein